MVENKLSVSKPPKQIFKIWRIIDQNYPNIESDTYYCLVREDPSFKVTFGSVTIAGRGEYYGYFHPGQKGYEDARSKVKAYHSSNLKVGAEVDNELFGYYQALVKYEEQ
jgi:hypothetical protein